MRGARHAHPRPLSGRSGADGYRRPAGAFGLRRLPAWAGAGPVAATVRVFVLAANCTLNY
jgi:hypothetical protein